MIHGGFTSFFYQFLLEMQKQQAFHMPNTYNIGHIVKIFGFLLFVCSCCTSRFAANPSRLLNRIGLLRQPHRFLLIDDAHLCLISIVLIEILQLMPSKILSQVKGLTSLRINLFLSTFGHLFVLRRIEKQLRLLILLITFTHFIITIMKITIKISQLKLLITFLVLLSCRSELQSLFSTHF